MTGAGPRILVAGIGNVFLGDDGFGVETARRLSGRPRSECVTVVDFGIRGMDLAYELLGEYDAVIFVDAACRGYSPGTLSVIDPGADTYKAAAPDAHGMDPVKVLALAHTMGAPQINTRIVACEPAFVPSPDSDDIVMKLTGPVLAAVPRAVMLVEAVIAEIGAGWNESEAHDPLYAKGGE